jgi:hypothetical protein
MALGDRQEEIFRSVGIGSASLPGACRQRGRGRSDRLDEFSNMTILVVLSCGRKAVVPPPE